MAAVRKILITANWKMHKTASEASAFVEKFLPQVKELSDKIEMALAPPFAALSTVGLALRNSGVKLVAQNMHFAGEGAYTGEISPRMLRDVDCTYVILGHSERRQYFNEDDALIHKKLAAAFEYELIPILCVGETLQERKIGATERVLERQLRAALDGVSSQQAARLVIAYEPVWAIGTGETASPQDAQQGARFLRQRLHELYDEATAQSVRIQYGGSVKPESTQPLIEQPDVDGLLIGGASLDPDALAAIVKAAARTLR